MQVAGSLHCVLNVPELAPLSPLTSGPQILDTQLFAKAMSPRMKPVGAMSWCVCVRLSPQDQGARCRGL